MFTSSRAPRKLALIISSWFCVPEQGMQQFEVLSRASAFLVKSRYGGQGFGARHRFPVGLPKALSEEAAALPDDQQAELLATQTFVPQYHVVTASHVVAPWKWPKYYPDEWLQYVNQAHTHYTIELRDETGVFITQSECLPVSYHHPTRDLAVLHLEDEQEHTDILFDLGYEVPELLLPPVPADFDPHALAGGGALPEWSTPTGDL